MFNAKCFYYKFYNKQGKYVMHSRNRSMYMFLCYDSIKYLYTIINYESLPF
jgi:hypothetical protein